MKSKSPEAFFLHSLIASYLSQSEPPWKNVPDLSSLNWEELSALLTHHELWSVTYIQLKSRSTDLPEKFWSRLENTYYQVLRKNILFEENFLQLARVFQARGIPLLPIKGISFLLDIYKNHPFRSMVDLDVLVYKNDLRFAEEALGELGFKKNISSGPESYWLEHQMHLEFSKEGPKGCRPILLELHWALDYPRKQKLLKHLWARAVEISCDGLKFKLLSPEDQILSLALHQRRPGRMFTLKYVIDIVFLFQKYKIDISYLLEETKKSRIENSLYCLLIQVRPFFMNPELETLILKLKVPSLKKKWIHSLIEINQFKPTQDQKKLFTRLHLLLFDSLSEPILYMIRIPFEQFCRYFNLPLDKKKSRFLYQIRHFYGFFRLFRSLFTPEKTANQTKEHIRAVPIKEFISPHVHQKTH